MIIYLVVSYLIALGMKTNWEYNEQWSSPLTSYIFFILAPISVPLFIGYQISKIKS